MTERKPPGVDFESWVDRQIREATERGEFDGLPGAGKPIPGIDRPHDDLWWVRQKMAREQLSSVPPTLALRKEAEDALDDVEHATSEAQVRRILERLNEKIRAAVRRPPAGPPLGLMPYDVDEAVSAWRARREG